jgi:hypothetical protein
MKNAEKLAGIFQEGSAPETMQEQRMEVAEIYLLQNPLIPLRGHRSE